MAETFRVLLSDSLAAQGIEVLKCFPQLQFDVKTGLKPAELAKIIAPYDALLIRSGTRVTREVIDAATSLKVIGRAGVGVDNIDIEAATRRGIVVMNSPTGNSVTTAEHAITMMMALARHIPAANASIRAGKWERGKFTGAEICNKTLGVVGLGNIGRIGVQLVSLDELFASADFITVHTPLTDDTRGIVGAAAFAKMKKGVRIINCARCGIVDEAALVEALKSGKVAGAALDVFVEEPPPANHPLLQFDNVIATPHLGAATDEAQVQVSVDIAHQVADFLIEGTIRQAVNIPALSTKELEILGPHLTLGEKLGPPPAQLTPEAPTELTLAFGVEAANLKPVAITAAVLKGLMSGFLDEDLNYVNAPFIARERGIRIIETRSREVTDYVDTLTVTIRP